MPETTRRTADVADYTFQVGDKSADILKVMSFTGTEGISKLFEFKIDLCSDEPDIAFEDVVGKPCVLEINSASGSRFVNGIVRRFERSGEGSSLTYYCAEVVPVHWLMTRRHKSRIFQECNCSDMTIPGVIQKVFEDAGIPSDNYRLALQGSYDTREYVVQYRESEMDFISRLMEEEGIFYFFEHQAGGHVMVLGDSPTAHVETPNLAEFAFRTQTGMVTEEEQEFIYDLRDGKEINFGAVTLDDYNFETPSVDLKAQASGDEHTSLEFSDYPGEYVEQSVGDRYATVRLEEFECQKHVQRMQSVVRALLPGFKFTLIEHPSEPLNREYLVTDIEHESRQPQSAQEEIGAEEKILYRTKLRTIPAAIPFRPERKTPKPRIHGTQTAVVVGPSGEEIYTDEYARVKLQYFWDREGAHDENSSRWTRVSQGSAGGQYGIMFIPRIGQEVIVEYLEGDPDRPMVTGRVYNKDLMPPYSLPDEKTKSVIKGHSSKGGGGTNEIRFEDLKDSEQLFIQAQKQMDLRVKADHFHTVGANYHVHVGADDDGSMHELIHKDKHVHIKNNLNTLTDVDESHEIKGKASIKVTGTQSTDVGGDVVDKYGMNHKHEVTMTYAAKALSIKLEASTGIELKCGGSSIVLTPAAIFVVGGPLVNINSGGGPPVGPVTASATSPEAATDADAADKSDPGYDVTYNPSTDSYDPVEPETAQFEPVTQEPEEEEVKTWIEIEMVDEADQPCAGERYEMELSDGKIVKGTLDANGFARRENLDPGSVKVRFPRLDTAAWERI